jgi:hypothetical protein
LTVTNPIGTSTATATVTVDATAPTITNFTFPAYANSTTVPIASLVATDNVSVAGYLIQSSSSTPLTTNPSWNVSPPASFTFGSSGSETAYAFAKDEVGNVSPGISSTVTIDIIAPITPGTPTATVISTSEIDLAWATSTDSGGSGLAGYNIYRDSSFIASTTNLIYQDTGLSASTQYTYAIAAFDAAGNLSPESSSTSATTSAAPVSNSGSGGGSVSVASAYGQPYTPAVGSATSTTLPLAPSSPAGNATNANLESQINALTAELDALLAQAATGNLSLPSGGGSGAHLFLRNLRLGETGSDITALQTFLINQNAGSASKELARHGVTKVFGMLTYNALKEFQKSVGITPTSGYFGPITRAYVDHLTGATIIP